MSDADPAQGGDPEGVYEAISEEVGRVLVGNEAVVEQLTVALFTRGHVLMEGVPGVAKTTIATLFAQASGLAQSRVQLTPDTLPADITGTTVYREATGEFDLQRGPVFANVVVADEINRATPKTQSALLEAMQERQVTIGGETLSLPTPFMMVATQNPIELEGTFELPEAQRDRFQFKLAVGIPDRETERGVLDRFDEQPGLGPEDVEAVVSATDIQAAREAVTAVHVAEPVKAYILDVVGATRESSAVEYGGSPRASLALLNGTKAWAALRGRDYVIPDDVKALARPTLRHRLVLSAEAELGERSADAVVEEILEDVRPPSADAEFAAVPETGG